MFLKDSIFAYFVNISDPVLFHLYLSKDVNDYFYIRSTYVLLKHLWLNGTNCLFIYKQEQFGSRMLFIQFHCFEKKLFFTCRDMINAIQCYPVLTFINQHIKHIKCMKFKIGKLLIFNETNNSFFVEMLHIHVS